MLRTELHIRKICSHPRATQSKCACSYYFFYGRDHRFSVDVQAGCHVETYSDAKALAAEWQQQIDNHTFVRRERDAGASAVPKGGLTLSGFSTIYLRDCSMLKKAGKDLKDKQHPDYYVFQPLLAFKLPDGRTLGDLPFAGIGEQMYELFVADRREQGYAASTVNKDVHLIKAFCRWGERRKYYGPYGKSPISGESRVLVRKKHHERQRRITDAMFTAMHAHADPILWAFIQLGFITCMRLTELYRVRWADYTGLTLTVRPDATKVETAARKAPLNDHAIALLQALRIDPAGRSASDDAFILGQFGEEPTSINDRFNTMILKAAATDPAAFGVTTDEVGTTGFWKNGVHSSHAQLLLNQIDVVFGDLRHEGALRKYYGGWSLNRVQRLLGHTTVQQTSTYLGVGDEDVLVAMTELGAGANVLGALGTTNLIYQKPTKNGAKSRLSNGAKHDLTH